MKKIIGLFGVLGLVLMIQAAWPQNLIGFEGLDANQDGQLSRDEFSRLPGFYGDPQLFSHLDQDRSRTVSYAEWIAGEPDPATGVPVGLKGPPQTREVGGDPRSERRDGQRYTARFPAVRSKEPDEPPDIGDRPERTGRGGANNGKRGVSVRPPSPPPGGFGPAPPGSAAPAPRR